MEIERSRHESRFTHLTNELLQNNDLSLTARGLAAYILSLPSGARVDIKGLAKRVPEGQTKIASALRELKAAGYIHQTRDRVERGRIHTRTVMYDTPHLVAPDLDSPGLGNARSGATRENTAKGQVAPDLAFPGLGEPGLGNARRKSSKEPSLPVPEEKTIHPSHGRASGEQPGMDGWMGGQDGQTQRAARELVEQLPPVAGRRPSGRLKTDLVAMVANHLVGGWNPKDLTEEMTRDLGSARSCGVYRTRLLNITPVPPAQKPAAATEPVGRHDYVPGGRNGACGDCGRAKYGPAHHPVRTSDTRCEHGRVRVLCTVCPDGLSATLAG